MRVQLQDSDGGVSVAKGTRWYGEQGELRGTEDCYSFRVLELVQRLLRTLPSVPGSGESVTNMPLEILFFLHIHTHTIE